MFAVEPTTTAANAINALGVDLLRQSGKPGENVLLSPYSIQSALAMTYAGAAGDTRTEMANVLHYPANDTEVHHSFAALHKALPALPGVMMDHDGNTVVDYLFAAVRKGLEDLTHTRVRDADQMQEREGQFSPTVMAMANRLFGQTGFAYRELFLTLLKDNYDAQLKALDFVRDPTGATEHINDWVAERTSQRIRNLIPKGDLDNLTRLVVVNAIYLKVRWAEEFSAFATRRQPFHLSSKNSIDVPTMKSQRSLGYARRQDCTVLTIPCRGGDLQFLILLPDKVDGLADVENKLTARLLADCAKPYNQELILYLPKFELSPPAMALSRELLALGMRSAFDQPQSSANFDGIAPRQENNYLYLSEVFHKAYLKLDEKGVEAAAATAVTHKWIGSAAGEPIEVRVDHPFLFAIQHRASGACLFLGHVSDPR
jgi:serpin B